MINTSRRSFIKKAGIASAFSLSPLGPFIIRNRKGKETLYRVADVNTRDIRDAILMGCKTMQNVFNADDNNIPFFRSAVRPEAYFGFSSVHSEAHVPGRHLNALLNSEEAIGARLDEKAVSHHRNAAYFSYSGMAPLPLNRQETGGPLVNFCPHNLREGFHALYALVKYRNDARARELTEKSISAIKDLWSPETGWDTEKIKKTGMTYIKCQGFIHGEGRMLGPLVKYFIATGYGPALELALILKDKAISDFYLEDGDYTTERFITRHSHSITCIMSSLAQLAELLNDRILMERVRKFYDNGLLKLRDEIGWSSESVFQKDTDHGEANNSGDILETALILGNNGFPQYFSDAERMLRCHILPCQLRDVSFIKDPPNPDNEDRLHNVASRHLGAFGFPAPYGHESIGKGRGGISFNLDIVGGTVSSLNEAYRNIAVLKNQSLWINMLFDHENEFVRIRSPYSNKNLEITSRKIFPVFIRIPSWVNRKELQVKGYEGMPQWSGEYLCLPVMQPGKPVAIHFPMTEHEITLSGNVHINPIRVRMRGDEVKSMENFGADLTYFDPLD